MEAVGKDCPAVQPYMQWHQSCDLPDDSPAHCGVQVLHCVLQEDVHTDSHDPFCKLCALLQESSGLTASEIIHPVSLHDNSAGPEARAADTETPKDKTWNRLHCIVGTL